jgi:hypothetical protein
MSLNINICVFMCMSKFMCIYVCIYIYICVCVCVCVCARVCACKLVCVINVSTKYKYEIKLFNIQVNLSNYSIINLNNN